MNEDNTNNVMIKQIYEEIIKSRRDLKSAIEASEARVLLKLESINNKVSQLEKENQQLKRKVEGLEIHNKKNNVVIFGVNAPDRNLTAKYICQELIKLLNIHLEESDINNVYPLGKSENRPVKVEFTTYLKKKLVLENCNKLKGTNISIVQDLTLNQRQDYKILKIHLNKAKENPENKCYIKGNKLHVNNISYSVEELIAAEEEDDISLNNFQTSNSAPPTPCRNIQREPSLLHEKVNDKDQSEKNSASNTTEVKGEAEKIRIKSKTKEVEAETSKGRPKNITPIQVKGRTRSTNK